MNWNRTGMCLRLGLLTGRNYLSALLTYPCIRSERNGLVDNVYSTARTERFQHCIVQIVDAERRRVESQRIEPDGLVRVGHRRSDHELSIDSANVDGGL